MKYHNLRASICGGDPTLSMLSHSLSEQASIQFLEGLFGGLQPWQ